MSKQDDELRPHLVRLFRAGHADGQARIPVGNNLYQIDQTEQLIRNYISTHYIPKAEVLRALEQVGLNDIYGNDWRNNYGYNEHQVHKAANWILRRIRQALGLTSKETEG